MPTLLLTEAHDAGCVIRRRIRWRDRVRARLCAWQLDVALAAGASPDASAVLSLRAGRLIKRRTRRLMAREIDRALREAERPRSPLDRSVAPAVCAIADADLLEQVADHLMSREPIDALGVARVRVLLRDGAGPLYDAEDPVGLRWSLMLAVDGLEPQATRHLSWEDADRDEPDRWH
jgi:hypothetical protein